MFGEQTFAQLRTGFTKHHSLTHVKLTALSKQLITKQIQFQHTNCLLNIYIYIYIHTQVTRNVAFAYYHVYNSISR